MAFFLYHYERPAPKHYRWWHNWAVRSRLKPMIEKARMMGPHPAVRRVKR
jgi:hypothetical protein